LSAQTPPPCITALPGSPQVGESFSFRRGGARVVHHRRVSHPQQPPSPPSPPLPAQSPLQPVQPAQPDTSAGPGSHWQVSPLQCTLVLAGDWRLAARRSKAQLLPLPSAANGAVTSRIAFDTTALTHWDAALAARLWHLLAEPTHASVPIDLRGLPEGLGEMLKQAYAPQTRAIAEEASSIEETQLSWLGGAARYLREGVADALITAAFLGEVLIAMGALLRGKSPMRGGDLLRQLDQTGPMSLPIVGLTCFLVGLMLAYMGGAQLVRMGAQSYIADVVTVGMVREMAGLMTGVILSGRLGAAFAAQLASMQANEEVDALRAMGVDPVGYLVLPRLLALVLVAPLLIGFAALIGVLAGLPAAVAIYGVPASEYLHKCLEALTWTHLHPVCRPHRPGGLPRRLARGPQRAGRRCGHHARRGQVTGVDRGGCVGHHGAVPEPGPVMQKLTATPLVRAQNLTLSHGNQVVQQGLDFDVLQGEVLCVVGASGSGKSTLLRHLVGLQEPTLGQVLYGSEDLYQADENATARLRRQFGVMFQSGALWSSMTVGENLMLPMRMFTPWPRREREQQARFKLALVGLDGCFDLEPSSLSGGMRKRAAIARALALDPQLLYLDEPGSGLDPLNAARLDELVLNLREHLGTTVVMVTHDIASVLAVADRMLYLDEKAKTMTALAAPQQLLQHGPQAVRNFLTRGHAAPTDAPADAPTGSPTGSAAPA
jgi:phospholipid/cholesterol/gamma-HCH transport system ATP-binding protein